MEEELKKVQEILEKYNQQHLLSFYDELTDDEKQKLLQQILNTDFSSILELYNNAIKYDKSVGGVISPLPYYEKLKMSSDEIHYFSNIGDEIIFNNGLAVVTLAGGQGTRLGFKGPKGTFELETEPPKSLFEVFCDYLKQAKRKYKCTIPWYIMTSQDNYLDTIAFFESKNYFEYGKENIYFFNQGNLPIIDLNGKLILEEIYKIKEASNGNGDVFRALYNSGLIQNMKDKGIKYISVNGVDNILCEIVDPLFIGLTKYNNAEVSSKTLFKFDSTSNQWIFAKKDDKPSIIDCRNFGEQLSALKDSSGKYLYRDVNMLAHLFSIEAVEKLGTVALPYHLAFRKNAFVNEEGMKQVPEEPNTYKFEKFIFDAFEHFDNLILLRVNEEEEFAPIKDFTGPHNPEVAKELYQNKLKKNAIKIYK